MTGSIYSLFIVHGFREAYYQLSKEERDQFWTGNGENDRVTGAKNLLICDSRWCNETYAAWGIQEYPDLQAVQKATRANEDNQHFRYIEAATYLGTKMEGLQTSPISFPNPLYQLFLVNAHNNNPLDSLPKEEGDRIFTRIMESIQSHGGVGVIGCDCSWSNEGISTFGVIAWPSLEAEQAHFKVQADIGWARYMFGKTLLGTKIE